MLPITSAVATFSVLEALRGGARTPPPPPPAALGNYDKLYADFYKWPEALRFFVSGNLGNMLFFTLERTLHSLLIRNLEALPALVLEYKDAVTFMVAYFIQIASQHFLNAYIVYGLQTISTREKYIKTLIACYSTYMGAMVGSTVLNTTLIKWGVNRTLSFILTMWTFACMNFFVLKYVNNKVVKAAETKTTKKVPTPIRGGAAFDVHNFVLSVGEPVDLQD